MLVAVGIRRLPAGEFQAVAPDFPGCSLLDADADSAMARLRLAIEGALADGFLAGRAAPALHPPAYWRQKPGLDGTQWSEVHINIPHIEAVARHQRRL